MQSDHRSLYIDINFIKVTRGETYEIPTREERIITPKIQKTPGIGIKKQNKSAFQREQEK